MAEHHHHHHHDHHHGEDCGCEECGGVEISSHEGALIGTLTGHIAADSVAAAKELLSAALTRRQLARVFLLESFLAAGIALAFAAPAALLLSRLFRRIVNALMISLPPVNALGAALSLGLALWAVFTLAALFPIRRLRAMDLAAQLKYE